MARRKGDSPQKAALREMMSSFMKNGLQSGGTDQKSLTLLVTRVYNTKQAEVMVPDIRLS